MGTLMLANLQRLTPISYVNQLDAVKRTCQKEEPVEMDIKRDSIESVLSPGLDDDFDVHQGR